MKKECTRLEASLSLSILFVLACIGTIIFFQQFRCLKPLKARGSNRAQHQKIGLKYSFTIWEIGKTHSRYSASRCVMMQNLPDWGGTLTGLKMQSIMLMALNTTRTVLINPKFHWHVPPMPKTGIEIQVRLQRPFVDIKNCIGCGVCEHECPVPGKRAIRITAENETRNSTHMLLLNG